MFKLVCEQQNKILLNMTKDSESKTHMGKLTNEVKGIKEMLEHHEKNKTKFKAIVITIFSICLIIFVLLWLSPPKLTPEESALIMKIPKHPKDLQNILIVIERYNKDNQVWVTSIWVYLYVL